MGITRFMLAISDLIYTHYKMRFAKKHWSHQLLMHPGDSDTVPGKI